MRIAFIAVLFANLAFLAWARWIDAPPEAPTSNAASRLPQLKLVGEVVPDQQERSATTSPSVPAPVPAPELSRSAFAAHAVDAMANLPRCVSVGPFNDSANAGRAANAFHTRGFAPRQRAEAGDKVEGYWVSIAGVDDADAADKVLIALDKGGFRDAHLMPDTGNGRAISVGLFSERARAERRAAAIEKLGLKTQIGERRHPGTVYWLDLALKADGSDVPPDLLANVRGGAGSEPGVRSCPPGALPKPAPVSAPNSPGSVPGVAQASPVPSAIPAAGPGAVPASAAALPSRSPASSRIPANTVAGTPLLSPAQ